MSSATMTFSTVPVGQPDSSVSGQSSCCMRCGGLLVDERCMDMGESLGGYWFMAMRCVQCGDIIDEIILKNRIAHVLKAQEVAQAA